MVPDELSGGPRFAAFCEHYLRHTKGRWAGQAVTFEPWERDFWWEALELDPATGLRVYQEVGLGLPRKNGKSTQASAFGLYGLVADQEAEPEVYVGAAAQQQAGIVMGQSLRMARRSPRLAPYIKVQTYRIEGTRTGGVMRALSSEGALQHGLNPHLNIIDEVHAHRDGELYTALTTGTGARLQPMTLWITTAGVDEENLLRDLYGQMYSGPGTIEEASPYLTIYRDRDNGVLIYWYGPPRDSDPADPAVWMGVNPASWRTEDALRKDYGKLIPKGKSLEWRIYHLNEILGAEEAWLPDGSWSALREGHPDAADPWHGLDPALPVGVGIDKMPQSEGAAVVVAQRRGERVLVRARHFAPESATGRVSRLAIQSCLLDIRARFPAAMVKDPKTRRLIHGPAYAYDPHVFTESAQALDDEGLNMVTFAPTAATMGPATAMVYELVTSGRLIHDGDPILARHVADTTALLTERGMRVTKAKKRSNASCIAMVMAVRMANVEAPRPYRARGTKSAGF